MIDLGGEEVPFVMGRTIVMVEEGSEADSLLNLSVIPGGLEKLANTQKVFICQQQEPLPFSTEFPPLSNFQLVNEKCEDINVVAELNPKGTDKNFIMHMFAPNGTLVLKMIQRHKNIWNVERQVELSDLTRYIERDQQLPAPALKRNSEISAQYELAEDKPDAHVHMELPEGIFLGTLWRSETAWVVHDNHLIPIYTIPIDPVGRNSKSTSTTRESLNKSDRILNYYTAGPEISTFRGPALGQIETNVELYRCGAEGIKSFCISVRFPDHFHVVDKMLILGVALNQYCRSTPLEIQDRGPTNQSANKYIVIVCTLVGIVIVALGILIVVGLAYTYFPFW